MSFLKSLLLSNIDDDKFNIEVRNKSWTVKRANGLILSKLSGMNKVKAVYLILSCCLYESEDSQCPLGYEDAFYFYLNNEDMAEEVAVKILDMSIMLYEIDRCVLNG